MKNLSENDNKVVAANIRRLREKAGLTQKELADRLYVSDNVVSKWERGESLPDPENIARLAEIFGVEAGVIIYDDKNAREHQLSQRTRRRLPQNFLTWFCIMAVTASAVVLFALSIKAYIELPDTIGIHFGADGKTDLYGSKAMLFMSPVVSVLFAAASIAFNFVKITWKVNFVGVSVFIDDLFDKEVNRNKIYKLLSAGLNITLLTAQSLFLLLGCCMALQIAVPVVALWLIVALILVVPVVFTVAGFVVTGKFREEEKSKNERET